MQINIRWIDGEAYVKLETATQLVVEAQNALVKEGFAMQAANVAPFTDPRRTICTADQDAMKRAYRGSDVQVPIGYSNQQLDRIGEGDYLKNQAQAQGPLR